MGKNNTELLKLAQAHLGQGGAVFNRYCNSSGAWCCAFVTYTFHEGNDSPLFYGGKKVVYCPTAIKWCSANLAMIPAYLALPMDIVFFDWNGNALPDHIGFIEERKNCDEVYTIEGNTDKVKKGKVVAHSVVAERTRPVKYIQGIYRPHFPASFDISKPLVIDGLFGYNSIAVLQKALGVAVDGILGKGTVKALQKWAGVAQDGAWATKTSKAIQKKLGVTADGYFGKDSCKALQKWCNSKVFGSKPTTNTYTGTLPSIHVKKTAEQVISDAIKWGKWIASDNSFHYGHGKSAHHNGCYFCGTNTLSGGRAKTGIKDWQKTYCCNPFVHACFAHGGQVPAMLSKCQSGTSYDFHKGRGYDASSLFKRVYNLQAGDVLCSDSHVALYIGGGKVVQAGHEDDNKPYSKSWNSSISVGTYKGYKRVYRLVKGVDADVPIRFGEYSDRVKQIQKFLNWYNGKNVLTEDGIFGEGTREYVKHFQYAQKIVADGIVGNGTLAKMKGAKR